jgi:uncharacterized NAD-dependent epimerase/dehydratase family protein
VFVKGWRLNYLARTARLALYVEGEFGKGKSKTAEGILRYGDNPIVAVIDSTAVGRSVRDLVGIDSAAPIVACLEDCKQFAPDALVLGTAKSGGQLPESWRKDILKALDMGLDVVSGLHDFLSDDPEINAAAKRAGKRLLDVRRSPEDLPIAFGLARDLDAFVLLTVGTDASIGKMTTTLELCKEVEKRGRAVKFIATGQTGIMVAGGEGIAIDRVIGDFMAGASEQMVVDGAREYDMIFVEGQGALAHPGFSGVTLALLHGSCPDAMILCHNASRVGINGRADFPLQSLKKTIEFHETMAGLVHPSKVVGIAINTVGTSEAEACKQIAACEEETGLPCNDTVRFGCSNLVDAILAFKESMYSCRPA